MNDYERDYLTGRHETDWQTTVTTIVIFVFVLFILWQLFIRPAGATPLRGTLRGTLRGPLRGTLRGTLRGPLSIDGCAR